MLIERLQNMLEFAYNLSPAKLVKWARVLRNQYKVSKLTDYPAPMLTRSYFTKQHIAILKLFEKLEQGIDLDTMLQNRDLVPFGERIVEYPYFYKWLLEQETGHDILDVGCVLNNRCVDKVLKERCNSVWFCNPSIERIQISNPVYYHLSQLENSFHNSQQFSLVTCLSTIEHIGYDNSQYGVSTPARYQKPSTEPFKIAFRELGRLIAPGGSLLISFPFGFREVLLNPGTGKISSQVMDYASLQECLPVLTSARISYNFVVYEATSCGWQRTEPRTCRARYANGRPGATAVAIIEGQKQGLVGPGRVYPAPY